MSVTEFKVVNKLKFELFYKMTLYQSHGECKEFEKKIKISC